MEKNVIKINEHIIIENFVKNLPYNADLKSRARALRKGYNYAEVVFWRQVRNGEFWNIDFDRQRIIGNYIVDFYVKKLGLIVEIDGESHNNKEDYDEKRENYLKNLGLNLFKVSSLRVLHDLNNVMNELETFIIEKYS